jgi:hypothetical protein
MTGMLTGDVENMQHGALIYILKVSIVTFQTFFDRYFQNGDFFKFEFF